MAIVYAGRYLGKPELKKKAEELTGRIVDIFRNEDSLGHSLYNGVMQEQSFLFDAAALLNTATLLYEDDPKWLGLMDEAALWVESFRHEGKWIESRTTDFPPVYASSFDHPIPSSVSLAETGIARYTLMKGKDLEEREYRQPFESDFFNLNAMIHNGLFHVFTSAFHLPWSQIPVNSIQVRGEHEQDCFMHVCSPLELNLKI
jgi:uncharacterized protein YyaL (SSP411 family)